MERRARTRLSVGEEPELVEVVVKELPAVRGLEWWAKRENYRQGKTGC